MRSLVQILLASVVALFATTAEPLTDQPQGDAGDVPTERADALLRNVSAVDALRRPSQRLAVRTTVVQPRLPDTATSSVRGVASWFCGGGSACTRGVPEGTLAAAAGPALRVGDWRGRIVKVCGNGHCVRVTLTDWCACPKRAIDLYRVAFSRLASPSRGLLHVTVSWGGASAPVPATDAAR